MKFIIPYQIVWYSYVSGTGERNVGNEEVGRVGEVGNQGVGDKTGERNMGDKGVVRVGEVGNQGCGRQDRGKEHER